MKIFLLNIGNSNVAMAEADGGAIGPVRTVPTSEFTAAMLPTAGPVAAATVVPQIKERLTGREIFYLENRHAAAAGLDLSQVDASTLGADRLANAVELLRRGNLPAAVFDFGTAITCEVVDTGGVFRGGAIAPGRKLLRKTLAGNTAQLPEIDWTASASEKAGANTTEAIRLGVDRGAIGAVKELIRITLNQFHPIRLYATGGDAPFFLQEIPELTATPPTFTLSGLLTAWQAARECERGKPL